MVLADYDECEFGLDNCHEDATCSGQDLGFNCTCNPGYTGDGVTCSKLILFVYSLVACTLCVIITTFVTLSTKPWYIKSVNLVWMT